LKQKLDEGRAAPRRGRRSAVGAEVAEPFSYDFSNKMHQNVTRNFGLTYVPGAVLCGHFLSTLHFSHDPRKKTNHRTEQKRESAVCVFTLGAGCGLCLYSGRWVWFVSLLCALGAVCVFTLGVGCALCLSYSGRRVRFVSLLWAAGAVCVFTLGAACGLCLYSGRLTRSHAGGGSCALRSSPLPVHFIKEKAAFRETRALLCSLRP